MTKLYLSDIYIYPIKSLGGIRLKEASLEERGFQFDRRWMLVDQSGTFISQREYPSLALLQVAIEKDQLKIYHKAEPEQSISFRIGTCLDIKIPVQIWDDQTEAREVDQDVSAWFSEFLGLSLRLVEMPDASLRKVDERYATDDEIVSFADGYPCLLIGQSSLDGLNEKLTNVVEMDRFRPNLVFTGAEAHLEDHLSEFEIAGILFTAIKPCARCVLITVNQQTGEKGVEPLKTLAGYRTWDKKVLFGQNLLHKGSGKVRVGDELFVKSWKAKENLAK